MSTLEERLADTLTELADEAPADPDLLGTVLRRSRRRSRSSRTLVACGAAAAVVAAAIGGGVLLDRSDQDPAPDAGSAGYECPASLTPAVIPAWARTGFSDPRPRMPYVLGDDGRIVAIVFGDPLASPPSKQRNNKILWVVRDQAGPLTIRATRAVGDDPVVVQATTGPSIVDLPAPGCWHLELSWGDQQDSMNLLYS